MAMIVDTDAFGGAGERGSVDGVSGILMLGTTTKDVLFLRS